MRLRANGIDGILSSNLRLLHGEENKSVTRGKCVGEKNQALLIKSAVGKGRERRKRQLWKSLNSIVTSPSPMEHE